MGMIYTRAFMVAFVTALCGCSSIQQTTAVATPTNQSITAGVGDIIFRAESRESMPNAFGRADIFGRTRSTGFVTLQYGGLRNGRVVLLRSGVTTQSDATTMNSTGILLPSQQTTSIYGMAGTAPFSATATSNGAVYIPPSGSHSTSAQQPLIPIEIDWHKDARVRVGGNIIVIENADDGSITYHTEGGSQ
jgi:hypothetical protein